MSDLIHNWSETKAALLEGLDQKQSAIVAPLLENQRKYLTETAAAGSTSADSVAGFRKILLPMIRRVMPGTIATELVGVQPMSAPVGLTYSLRYKYADAITTNADAGPIDHGVGDIDPLVDPEAFSNVNALRRFYSGSAGNATTDIRGDAQAAGAGGIGGAVNLSSVATGNGWGSALDSTAASMTTGSQATKAGAYNVGGSMYGGSGSYLEGSGGRRMTLEVVSQAVEAGTRKLQAGWTVEAMQDLNSQHGLNIENEMVSALSAEITQEIDNEIINDLLALAGTVSSWDGSTPGAPGYYTPTFVGDRFANLGVQINALANEIARKTRRGAGNFIVVSPMIVSVLQSAAKSVFAPAVRGSFKGPNNSMLVGTLNGTIKVYSYLFNQVSGTNFTGGYNTGNDQILVGYKGGNGETDTGYFFCPYIPLMSSGVVVNPITFQPVVSLMTRYGKTSFTSRQSSLANSGDYFAKLNVSSLSFN